MCIFFCLAVSSSSFPFLPFPPLCPSALTTLLCSTFRQHSHSFFLFAISPRMLHPSSISLQPRVSLQPFCPLFLSIRVSLPSYTSAAFISLPFPSSHLISTLSCCLRFPLSLPNPTLFTLHTSSCKSSPLSLCIPSIPCTFPPLFTFLSVFVGEQRAVCLTVAPLGVYVCSGV